MNNKQIKKKKKEILESLNTVYDNSEDVLESLLDGLNRMLEYDRRVVLKNLRSLVLNQKEEIPKWPGLLVVGKKITKEQAAEIIVRTNQWGLMGFSNDNDFSEKIKNIYIKTLPIEELISPIHFNYEILESKIKGLQLYHLYNDRIDSCWIGGLKGWCDWDGTIFCNNYNVGKWPSYREIFDDLQAISSNFPYLNFKLQLLNYEIGEEETVKLKPVLSFQVKDGGVKELFNKKLITKIYSNEYPYRDHEWLKDKNHVDRVLNEIERLVSKT